MKRLLFLLFLLVGVGLLGGSGYWTVSNIRFRHVAVEAEGTVVKLERRTSSTHGRRRIRHSRTRTTWAPVFEFTDASGQTNRVTSSVSSNPAGYKIGEKVSVLYSAAEPQNAKIDSFMSFWFGPVLVGGVGLVFALIGGIALFRSRHRV